MPGELQQFRPGLSGKHRSVTFFVGFCAPRHDSWENCVKTYFFLNKEVRLLSQCWLVLCSSLGLWQAQQPAFETSPAKDTKMQITTNNGVPSGRFRFLSTGCKKATPTRHQLVRSKPENRTFRLSFQVNCYGGTKGNKEKREKETAHGLGGSQPWFGGQRINCGLGSLNSERDITAR